MAIVTVVFGLLLLGLGGYGYKGPADLQGAALYPVIFGVLLVVFGLLARSKSEKMRMIVSHINASVGLIGMLLAAVVALNTYGTARSNGDDPDMVLIKYLLAMAVVLLVYLNLCIRSFLNARAARKAAAERD
jgi:uncharacterized membrane protein